ncbi:hypothetical protein EMCRGX_G025502 [Ephydatia muelleri]
MLLFSAGICARPQHRSRQAPAEIIKNYEVFTPVVEYNDKKAVSVGISIVSSTYNFTLRLSMNRHLLSPGFSSLSINGEGKETLTKGHANCFYQGEVDGHPTWTAALSTCNGLRGSFGNMAVKTELYHIEPLRDNVTKSLAMDQPHIIFLETEYRNRTRTCGTPHNHTVRPDILSRQELLQLKEKRQAAGNLIVELVIVNDFSQYQKYGSNLEITVNRALDVVNGADSLYKPLGIRIVLVQAITWSSGNKITVVSNSGTLLDNFRVYAPSVTTQHDVTMLLTGTNLDGNIDFGSLPAVSSTMAHEIGHLFSMQHDTATCSCSQSTGCIMGAVQGSMVPNKWSSCSTQYLSTALGANHAHCLTNQPQSFVGSPVCGNGIREGNEICDCGSAAECRDPCCNPSTCQLAAGAQCTSGACCSNCRFVAYGTPAQQTNTSGMAPSCGSGIGYCYNGSCPTRDNQCKAFYGSAGGDGVSSCYSNYNTRGDLHGNCGPTGATTYAACSASNVLCGSLQCANTGTQFPALSIIGSTQLGTHGSTDAPCKSFVLTPSDGSITNIWLVQNGTKCGTNQICLSSQCLALTNLNLPSCPVGSNGLVCSGNGICTNTGTCICKVGFTGSLCNVAYTGPTCVAPSPSPSIVKITSTALKATSSSMRVASTPVRVTSTSVTSTPVMVTSIPLRVTSTPVVRASTALPRSTTTTSVMSSKNASTTSGVRLSPTPTAPIQG